ncbi:MAG: diphthine--ammonia ligase [Candidatus Omnitrophota bacterium]|nr:MAG: diphthine--ammonia ligase [Candidatus Omnitrophota bacterium]
MRNNIKAVASWSGGKDCAFACYEAINMGYDIKYLVNNISEEYGRVSFHGVKGELIKAQSKAIGIPLKQIKVFADNYEEKFIETMKHFRNSNIKNIVFGDIDLQEHKDWIKKVCKKLDMYPVIPLWGKTQQRILQNFISLGFKAVIVGVNPKRIKEDWAGRILDNSFLDTIESRVDITPSGEQGEYHTFVFDGPLFKKRIKILEGYPLTKDGYRFFEIFKYKLSS